jgi:ABC-type oligopeptide transport system substrate-binding subunit
MNKINNYHFKKLLNLQIKKYENNTIRYMNNKDFKNFIKNQHKVLTKINIEQTNKIIDFHKNRTNYFTYIMLGGFLGCILGNIEAYYLK